MVAENEIAATSLTLTLSSHAHTTHESFPPLFLHLFHYSFTVMLKVHSHHLGGHSG